MKKRLLLLLVCALVPFVLCAASSKVKAYMKENVGDINTIGFNYGEYSLSFVQDNYGRDTSEPCLEIELNGSFSNSATKNSFLTVDMVIKEGSLNFDLYEYGLFLSSSEELTDEYKYRIEGNDYSLGWSRIVTNKTHLQRIFLALCNGYDVEFSYSTKRQGVNSSSAYSYYLFTLPSKGFRNAYYNAFLSEILPEYKLIDIENFKVLKIVEKPGLNNLLEEDVVRIGQGRSTLLVVFEMTNTTPDIINLDISNFIQYQEYSNGTNSYASVYNSCIFWGIKKDWGFTSDDISFDFLSDVHNNWAGDSIGYGEKAIGVFLLSNKIEPECIKILYTPKATINSNTVQNCINAKSYFEIDI